MTTVVFGYYQDRLEKKKEEEEEEVVVEAEIVQVGHHTPSSCYPCPATAPENHPYSCDFNMEQEEEESELEFHDNLFDSLDIPDIQAEASWFGTNDDIFSSTLPFTEEQSSPLVCDEVLEDTFDSSEGTLSDSSHLITPPLRRRPRPKQPRYLRIAWPTRDRKKKNKKRMMITRKKPLVPTPVIFKEEMTRPGHYKLSVTGRLSLVRPWNVAMDQFPPERRQLVKVDLFH